MYDFEEYSGFQINGIVNAIPSQIELNSQIDWIPERLLTKLISSIGIDERRVAPKNRNLSFYAISAAKELILKTGIDTSEIGSFVLITQTGDQQIPATAIHIQTELGLKDSILALEINLGCSGFVHGLNLAAKLLNSQKAKYSLLICGDISTSIIGEKDSGTTPLFSDGVSAILLSKTDGSNEWRFRLSNNYRDSEAISMQASIGKALFKGEAQLKLDGHKILLFGLTRVVPGMIDFMKGLGSKPVDYYYFHQASKIINEALRKKLEIDIDKFPYSLGKYGNMSSATIPITMALHQGLTHKKSNLVLCGFGTGLSWGGAYLETPPISYLSTIEI
jgi:3-oxoacyl-[acyl-carrier-protein] synthase-3